jgi:subtilisin family serine protease
VASELAQGQGLEVTHTYQNALEGFAAEIPDEQVDDVRSDPRVEFVAQDRVVKATAQQNPTGIDRVVADQSSTKAGNGSGTVDADIAILDTGIYKNHRDLNISGGLNCTGSNEEAYSDGNGHGTHVAGTTAAKDNDTGVVGVAPGARLWAVKVLNKNGSGSFSSIICGINWVTGKNTDSDTTNDIEVANMSLGGPGTDDGACGSISNNLEHRAICGSVAAGVFYAVAAGNAGTDFRTTTPAAYNEVLTVTAIADFNGQPGGGARPTCGTDTDDTAANFSNYATIISDQNHTIAAPGVCIRSTWKGSKKKKKGTYKTISGTSMASPHVAGTAALCIATSSTTGKCTGGPLDVLSDLRSDAAEQPASYGFIGDPHPAPTGPYYGYLEFAGDY